MKKLGLKWAMVLGQLGYAVYIAAQFFPSFATLIPAAVVAGLLAAPLVILNTFKTNFLCFFFSTFVNQVFFYPPLQWSGKSTYLAQVQNWFLSLGGDEMMNSLRLFTMRP